jgi:hypothetical protein
MSHITNYGDFGISTAEFFADPELRRIYARVCPPRSGADHAWRVTSELQKRARAGGLNDNSCLILAEKNDRRAMLKDFEAYKNGTYQP